VVYLVNGNTVGRCLYCNVGYIEREEEDVFAESADADACTASADRWKALFHSWNVLAAVGILLFGCVGGCFRSVGCVVRSSCQSFG
jgi:hypothetical protein